MFTVIRRSGAGGPSPVNGAVGFAVEAGRELASGELLAGSRLGDRARAAHQRPVGAGPGRGGACRHRRRPWAAAGPGTELHLTANAEGCDDWLDDRLALFESCGFTLWQEKEGFWWADGGQDVPGTAGRHRADLAEVGRERFAGVIAACTAGTLDRVDADAIGSMGGGAWAAALMGDAAAGGGRQLAGHRERRRRGGRLRRRLRVRPGHGHHRAHRGCGRPSRSWLHRSAAAAREPCRPRTGLDGHALRRRCREHADAGRYGAQRPPGQQSAMAQMDVPPRHRMSLSGCRHTRARRSIGGRWGQGKVVG